jgi:hypothetical protein
MIVTYKNILQSRAWMHLESILNILIACGKHFLINYYTNCG